jgi:hypothetical protein
MLAYLESNRIIINMSEIDMQKIAGSLGASEETVQKWKDEGLIKSTPLKGTLRPVTEADIQRMEAEGTLYGPMPEGLLTRLAGSMDKPEEPASPAE